MQKIKIKLFDLESTVQFYFRNPERVRPEAESFKGDENVKNP